MYLFLIQVIKQISMKNLSKLSLVLLLSSTLLFQSCATLFGGGKDTVKVKNGYPNNAQVYYNGSYKGEASEKIRVSKSKAIKDDYIEIKEEGYVTEKVMLHPKTQIGYFLLDLFIFFPSLIIDYATGNIYTPRPGKIKYELQRDPNYKEASKYKVNEAVTFEYKDNDFRKGTVIKKEYNKATIEYPKGDKKKTKEIYYSRISKI